MASAASAAETRSDDDLVPTVRLEIAAGHADSVREALVDVDRPDDVSSQRIDEREALFRAARGAHDDEPATSPGDVGDTHLDTRTPGRQRLNHRSVWILAAERADPSRRR